MGIDTDRQIRLIILALAEMRPGIACMDTTCPQTDFSGMPHMASDGGNHPHPYGLISSKTHVWRRRRWWMR